MKPAGFRLPLTREIKTSEAPLRQPDGGTRTAFIAEIEPRDRYSISQSRSRNGDRHRRHRPATSSPRTWTFARLCLDGARNPCPMSGRKNYRAGEVCQPDSSWPNGTYQWRCWAGTGVQYTDLRQTRRRLEPAHSPWSWRAAPRKRCEQPWPGLRIRLPQSAQPTRRSFWSFVSPYGGRSRGRAQLLVLKSGQPLEEFPYRPSTKRELVPSHPVTAAAMVARECVRREIIRAVAVAAVRDAAAGRRTRALQRGPVGRSLGR